MTIKDFQEQFNFAASAMSVKEQPNGVKVLVKLTNRPTNRSVVLNVKELGYNDKENMIYIEASE